MSNAAVSTTPAQFEIANYKMVNEGNILGRFDLVVAGLITIYKCGLFAKADGTKFVSPPSFNRGKYDASVKNDPSKAHIKSGSFDRSVNPTLTAAAEAAHSAALAKANAMASGGQS